MINSTVHDLIIKATYFLYVAFITIGCSSNEFNNKYLSSEKREYTDSLDIYVNDTVTFLMPNDIPSELYFFNMYDGSLYGLSYIKPYSIYKLGLEDGVVDEFFTLEPKHQHFKIRQYFVNDTLVSVISEFGEIMEFNLKTNSYEYFRNENVNYPSEHGYVTPFLRMPPNLQLINNDYYFNVYPMGYLDNYSVSEKTESPLMAHLTRDTRKLSFTLAPKGIMAAIGNEYYPYDLSFPYLTYIEDRFYISYPMSHQVFIYDSAFQYLDQVQVAPSQITVLPHPMEYKDFLDEQYLHEFRMKSSYYSKINYHSDMKIMSRVFYSQNSVTIDNGKYKTKYGDSNVLFFNKEGRILKEFEISRDENLLTVGSDLNQLIVLKRKSENELQAIRYNIESITN